MTASPYIFIKHNLHECFCYDHQEYLDAHKEKTHGRQHLSKQEQLKCPLCSESFITTEDLCAHIVTHAPSTRTAAPSPLALNSAEGAECHTGKMERSTIMRELLQDGTVHEAKGMCVYIVLCVR